MTPKRGRPRTRQEGAKRTGTAFWFPDQDGALLREIAAAEDRTLQMVLRRALQFYADHSDDYGRWKAMRADLP